MHPLAFSSSVTLADVQGNILKGHGRRYAALVLFRFGNDIQKNLALLRAAADTTQNHAITPASQQEAHATVVRQLREKNLANRTEHAAALHHPFRSLGITGAGLRACGLTEDTCKARWGWAPPDTFWKGMTAELLDDPAPWGDAKYRPESEPHGVWLLANEDFAKRKQMIDECERWLASFGSTVTGIELGFRWRPDPDGPTREPFGFVDGFARTRVTAPPSSPLSQLIRRGMNGVFRLFAKPYEIPLSQVMLEAPPALAGSSFLVLRKLEQNVREFLHAEDELRKQFHLLPKECHPKDPGALFIGRNRDGTPLAHGGRPLDNLFHFGRDPKANRCPFHAHIRKMNLRQNTTPGSAIGTRREQKSAQFVRRGMVYGEEEVLKPEWKNPEEAPQNGVGLLFMGYLRDISRQFVLMHKFWGQNTNFPTNASEGVDPLISSSSDERASPRLEWSWSKYGLSVKLEQRFVTPVGGAYFLIPSLIWLKNV